MDHRPPPFPQAFVPGAFFRFSLLFLLALAAPRGGAAAILPDLPVTDGPVYALAIDQARGLLYVAGDFTLVGPADDFAAAAGRRYLAAIDLQSGAATDWNPNPDQPVRALLLSPDGAILYIGGDFDAVGGRTRHRIAALRTDTGVPTDQWVSGAADGTVDVLLAANGGASVFVGGTFTTILCAERTGLAQLTLTGTNSSCGGTGFANELGLGVPITGPAVAVRALAQVGDRLYVGGSFSQVGGQPRLAAAAFDVDTFDLLDWAPAVDDGAVEALHIVPGRAEIYAGGTFTSVAGVARAGLVALDAGDAHPLDWDAGLRLNGDAAGVAARAIASSLDRSVLYVGGDFDSVGGVARQRLAAIRIPTAAAVDDWQLDVDATVRTLLPSESLEDLVHTLYAGGDFAQAGGSPRAYLVAADALAPETDPPLTTATPAGGLLNNQTLTPIVLRCEDAGAGCAATYYTTDGTEPTEASSLYNGPIAIAASGVLKYFSIDNVDNREAVRTETYTVEVTPPQTTASPGSEVFFGRSLAVTLTCSDAAPGCAATYYTTDGSTPTTQSTRYTGPVVLNGTTVLQFFSVDAAGNAEGIQRQEYAQNRGKVGALSPLEAAIGAVMAVVCLARRRRRGHG
jgi:hypothetical protein